MKSCVKKNQFIFQLLNDRSFNTVAYFDEKIIYAPHLNIVQKRESDILCYALLRNYSLYCIPSFFRDGTLEFSSIHEIPSRWRWNRFHSLRIFSMFELILSSTSFLFISLIYTYCQKEKNLSSFLAIHLQSPIFILFQGKFEEILLDEKRKA